MDRTVKIEESNLTGIFLAVFAIVLTFVILALYHRRKTRRNCVLLTGLCDSGKTLILSQLIYKRFVHTHTSIKENVGSYIVNNKYLKIVDVPGHERLYGKFVEQYSELTRGVVFIVDCLTIQQNIRDASEFLYNILTEPAISRNVQNILILCNKQDQTLSKGSSAVKSLLEKELNTLCITKASQLESVDPKLRRLASLGRVDGDFSFYSSSYKVDFAECYACSKDGSVNIDELNMWLVKIA